MIIFYKFIQFSEAFSEPSRVSEMEIFVKLLTVFRQKCLIFKWVLNTLNVFFIQLWSNDFVTDITILKYSKRNSSVKFSASEIMFF